MSISVGFGRLNEQAVLPARATDGAAGYDLAVVGEHHIPPRTRYLLPTGICLAAPMPPHLELQIRPRSSLFKTYRLIIPNSPGTVDSDYTGEIFVQVYNMDKLSVVVPHAARVAQIVFNFVELPDVLWATIQPRETRGGFGSTGT